MAVKAKAQISVVNLAVETETLADVVTRVTETEAKIKENSDNITSTVKKTETIETTLGKTNETVTTHSSQISTLQQTAEGFEARITSNKTVAEDAQSAATASALEAHEAKNTANSANGAAAVAQSTAETAQSTANTAKTAAGNAVTLARDAEKVATNYLKFSEDTGLLVGDMTTDTVGYNTQIMSDQINLRSGETILGSFRLSGTQSIITLGQSTKQRMVLNSAGATIYDADSKQRAKFGAVTKIGNPSEYNIDIGTAGMIVYNGTTEKARYSDTIQLRDGENILAEFTDDTIYLGKNSVSSVIDLCNSRAELFVDDINGYFELYSDVYDIMLYSDQGVRLATSPSNKGVADITMKCTENSGGVISIYTRSAAEANISFIRLYPTGMTFRVHNTSWKPYYTAGDSFTINISLPLSGFITNSGKDLYFALPLSKPMIGVSKVTVTNHTSKSLCIRQNGSYVWDSAASTWVNPDSWSANVTEGMIQIKATKTSKTYLNNYPAGIMFRGTITFS